MEKNILIIDDNPDKRAYDALKNDLEEEVNEGSDITYRVNLDFENPMHYIDFRKKGEEYSEFFELLNKKYLSKKLDIFLCDFNLHSKHKHIAFHIISHVRKFNKACSIILFSGSPLKELIRINNNDLAGKISEYINQEDKTANVGLLEKKLEEFRKEEEPAEELMQIAVESNISAIISRTQYEEAAKELITKPSLILWIENELLKNGPSIFNDGNPSLDGKTLEDIAKHIREQTAEGISFTREIIQISLANLIHFTN